MNFSGALDTLIKWRGLTEEQLAESSALSEKTIQRLRNDEPNNVTIETVVQLCIGMQLPPILSYRLMAASGNQFMMTRLHLVYQFLLLACYTEPINSCNKILIGQELNPLGRLNKTVS